ncbi:nitronate monooxygenase [Raoultella sp. BIGb0138]|uniref:NAD(P)H-dependent flavin oxidoreductase n=1 Tax=Raoultella sp. BIGb0138 TaxID=2485115 RepID=UPI00104AFB76|nr:nitronate monooxygenase [Raoultella sp. BIGb0138]TCW08541.1 nitronate monooxygenase [Raoultella sp. BIGb0138]
MTRSLTQRLDIAYPIIQAPMAGVATPALAAAVSNAGALGSLGLGASSVAQAETLIDNTRRLTAQPFNVNLFCHAPAQRDSDREAQWIAALRPLFARFGREPPEELAEIYPPFSANPQMADLLLDLKPAVVSFHFGVADKTFIRRLRERGVVTMASATCVTEAQQIAAQGIDIIIAQGYEAGGHRGIFDPQADDRQMSTATLVQALQRVVSLPVVAAGGIMDGAGISRVMRCGAAGAQLGTAFLLCPESATDAGYRQALTCARDPQTVMTAAISGRPARCVDNAFCEIGRRNPACRPPDYPVAYDIGKALAAAAKAQGDYRFGAHWAGQGVGAVRELPAAELIQRFVDECGF